MAFSPPVLGYLVKKGLQKGGSRAPQDPPDYAIGWNGYYERLNGWKKINGRSWTTEEKFWTVQGKRLQITFEQPKGCGNILND